ncbi:MAG: hypothetical protein R2748_27020 [Bryobacterales bacterium]
MRTMWSPSRPSELSGAQTTSSFAPTQHDFAEEFVKTVYMRQRVCKGVFRLQAEAKRRYAPLHVTIHEQRRPARGSAEALRQV